MERRQFIENSLKATLGTSILTQAPMADASPQPPTRHEPRNPFGLTQLPGSLNRKVLVIGGGLAGLSAALELAERGFHVDLRESSSVLGGKLATYDTQTSQGIFRVEHGLHMWFDNYHTFKDIRKRLDIDRYFVPYGKVHFVFRDYKPEALESSPAIYPLNMINLLIRSPNFNPLEAAGVLGMIGDVLGYRHEGIYDRLDHLTFEEWAKQKRISKKFFDIFMEPAASVTLNDPSKVGAAEMVHFMHYFFTGQPKAMNREVTITDHGSAVIDPWVERLKELGVQVSTQDPVSGLKVENGQVMGTTDSALQYDWVVMASDVKGTKAILSQSEGIDAKSRLSLERINARISKLRIAPHYKIMRVFFDKQPKAKRPDIIETPQHVPINLLAQFHLLERESKVWADQTGGSVIEFHLYNVPELNGLGDFEVWEAVRATFLEILPEMQDAKPLDIVIGNYENFTSYEVNQGRLAPRIDFAQKFDVQNLSFCGDWVHLDFPAALMEKAVVSGRMAANECLIEHDVKEASYLKTSSKGPGLI